jgi:precorrin-6B methylase 2
LEILEGQDDIGPATALSPKERRTLIDFAKIGKNDVFYDLGSGNGRLVVDVVKKTKAKRAVGIEVDYHRFCNSVRYAQREVPKQLDRIEFYCANYYSFDFLDATVIYEGHERASHEVETLDDILRGNKTRIITLDLPLIRCRTAKPVSYKDTQFFKCIRR